MRCSSRSTSIPDSPLDAHDNLKVYAFGHSGLLPSRNRTTRTGTCTCTLKLSSYPWLKRSLILNSELGSLLVAAQDRGMLFDAQPALNALNTISMLPGLDLLEAGLFGEKQATSRTSRCGS
ncbi:hypothetical protein QYE76_070196 [Lolium multiflorum]|uniref:Uncharacterized protein n=1 Tax=Lolium multiflorum TaxID=4521 RepID=A0AAD8SJ61_LOLMU|nr:hypothetical protein QYE76_070196 [Lolium multiflorum]